MLDIWRNFRVALASVVEKCQGRQPGDDLHTVVSCDQFPWGTLWPVMKRDGAQVFLKLLHEVVQSNISTQTKNLT